MGIHGQPSSEHLLLLLILNVEHIFTIYIYTSESIHSSKINKCTLLLLIKHLERMAVALALTKLRSSLPYKAARTCPVGASRKARGQNYYYYLASQRGNSTSVLGTLSSFDGLDDF